MYYIHYIPVSRHNLGINKYDPLNYTIIAQFTVAAPAEVTAAVHNSRQSLETLLYNKNLNE
jgi:hypothetical protein